MDACADWVHDYKKTLEGAKGQDLFKGSNGGIAGMGPVYWDCHDGEEHTTWKIEFKNGEIFYIDCGFLQGGYVGPVIGAPRFSPASEYLPTGQS